MKKVLFFAIFGVTLWAQGLQDQAQRTTPSISGVTSRALHGCGAPGAVTGNLSQDTYLDTCAAPPVDYICAAAAGATPPACAIVASGQWQPVGAPAISSLRYDVVANYNAAASNTTTTGTMVSGQSTLTVTNAVTFAVRDGLLAVGCAAASSSNPAGNLVATIASISGTVFTLNASATANCTGVLVAHDDTAAANAANADCMNNGGGLIWYRNSGVDGIYKFSAPANATTSGVLTFPPNLTYQNPAHCRIAGEAIGNIAPGNLSLQPGGVSWDFSLAPNVAGTSALAPAAYVPITSPNFESVFNSLDVDIDEINIWLPAHTAMNGLMLNNVMQASVGKIYLSTKADSYGTFNQPAAGTTGIWMPGWLNNVQLRLGQSVIFGFDHCVTPGEHQYFDGTYLVNCNTALYLYTAHDTISGHLKIEQSPLMLQVDSSVTNRIPIDLTWDNESCLSIGPTCAQSWQVRAPDDLVDPNNKLFGSLRYKIKDGSEDYDEINKNGGANLVYCNLGAAPTAGQCTP